MAVSQKKIDACRRNWAKRGPLSEDGRRRQREAAKRDRPWRHASGPKTVKGKARSRLNALKSGTADAHHRVARAYLVVIRRVTTTMFFVNAQLDRRDRGSAFFCRYTGTLADLVIAIRRVKNLPPESRGTTICTEWLAMHKWLGEVPVEHGNIPLNILVESCVGLPMDKEARIAATDHIVTAMIGRRAASRDLGD